MTSAWTRRMNSLPSSWRQTDGPEDASGAATANVTPWGGEGRGSGRVQDQEARGVFKHFWSTFVCSSARIRLSFFSLSFASAGQTDALHVHVPTLKRAPMCLRACVWMFVFLKKQM